MPRPVLAWLAIPGPTPVPTAVPTTAPGPAAPYDVRPPRPVGVALLSLVAALGGLAAALGGIFLATAGGAAASGFSLLGALGAALFFFVGLVALVVGLALLVLAYGLWEGHGWAWTVTLVLVLLGLLGSVLNLLQGEVGSGLVNLLVDLFLLWYLTRGGVQRWFAKQGAWPAPQVDALLERARAP